MPTVTAILPHPKREGRYEILVDGRAIATVSAETIDALKLRVGAAVDDARRAAVDDAALALRTYDRALTLLAFRGRSRRELERALIRKGEPADRVHEALERLARAGLLDDAMYARQFARSKVAGQGLSRRRMIGELRRRGVAAEVAEEAIAEVFADDEIDESAVIDRVAAKKLRTLANLPTETQKRRLYAFLARRGYDPDAIRRVIGRMALGESVRSEK